jgi:hypothetical protein
MEARIVQMIEEEVELRLNERIGHILAHISKTYDVSMKQLLKDASMVSSDSEFCMGLTAKNKRCNRRACKKSKNGYCAVHQNQKPIIVRTVNTTAQNHHNHPPEQLFVKGCQGCERKHQKVLIDI